MLYSLFHAERVLQQVYKEYGRVNVYNNHFIARKEVTLDQVCMVILQEASQPQRNNPQLLVGCANAVYVELGWDDFFKPEAFRRQFQRIQLERKMYPPDEEGLKMREAKRAFVKSKNKNWKKTQAS